MNAILKKFCKTIPFLLAVCFFGSAEAQVSTSFQYTIANQTNSTDWFEFDLLLLNLDNTYPFQLTTIQTGILVNPGIFSGGIITPAIVAGASDLLPSQAPSNITYTQSAYCIKIAPRAPPGCGSGTIISQNPASPTRVCRVRFTSTTPWVGCTTADLMFNFSATPYATKISEYDASCIQFQPGVNASNCFNDSDNLLLIYPSVPQVYTVTGGGHYCTGAGYGAVLGLSGSDLNVIYTVYKNGIPMPAVVLGTGAPLSFGLQTPGIYDIIGSRSCGTLPVFQVTMNGPAVIVEDQPTIPGTVSGPDSIVIGESASLTLSGNLGAVLKWQKRLNSGTWTDITCTTVNCIDMPSDTGSWEYRAVVQNWACPAANSVSWSVYVKSHLLGMKAFLQGLYLPGTGLMAQASNGDAPQFPGNIADHVTIELANSAAPFNILFSIPNVELQTNGMMTMNLPPSANSSYYLIVKQRNSISTWSSVPVNLGAEQVNYDFTDAPSKAYGNNLVPSGSVWLIYGGDVNADGLVDSGDMIDIDNAASVFATGYLPEDANGDGLVDAEDMILVDNNVTGFAGVIHP
ncbi:MAG: hypothetical protein IPH88_12065 [Bacteroidales bacterium]|nr:hypothetical protein [Bacteroidales bacterium]